MSPKKRTVKVDADLIAKLKMWVRIPGFRAGFELQKREKRSERSNGRAELESETGLLEDQNRT